MYIKTSTILFVITSLLLGCGCSSKSAAAPDDNSAVKAVMESDSVPESVKNFVQAVANDDEEAVSEMVSYPLQRPYPLHDITDASEMRKHYSEIIDDSIRKVVTKAGPERWKEYGWRGWSLDDGKYIWVDETVYDLQYVSQKERELIDSLTNEEINTIEPSIREGWKPVMCMINTKNGHIYRVDARVNDADEDSDHYRLVVYDGHADLSGMPEKLLDGVKEHEGSIGNVLYKFNTNEGREIVIEPDAPDTGYPTLFEPNDSTTELERAYWHELVHKNKAGKAKIEKKRR